MFESPTAHPARRFAAGFTILELMVTVAVASVLLAIAVPAFNQMIVSGRLTAQSNDMLAALTLARSEAIRRNGAVTLCRSSNMTACANASGAWQGWIIIRNVDGALIRQGTVNNFGGTLVVRSTLVNDLLVFGPDGLARTNSNVDRNFTVCSTRRIDSNLRQINFGTGSRMATSLGNTTTCT